MLRLLGQSEYGLLSLASSVVAYLGLLGFGISASYIRYNAKYREANDKAGEARLNGMFLTTYIFIGIVAFLCGIVLVFNISNIFNEKLSVQELETARVLMFILVINISISFPASVFGMYNNAYEKFVFGRIIALIAAIASPFITLPLLLMGGGSVVIVLVQTGLAIITSMLMIYYSIRKLKMRFLFDNFDRKLAKEILTFSGFVFINIIVDQINWNVDKFLLGIFVGTTGVAIYSIGAQFNVYYASMSYAVSGVFTRRISAIVMANKEDGNEQLTKIFNDIGRIQFLIVGLIVTGFSLVGRKFVYMWAGPEYNDAFVIALILMITAAIPLLQYMGTEILRAKNIHQFRSLVFLGIGIGNVLISIPLCKIWGGIGCAIGTAISVFIGNVVFMNIYYQKKVGLNVFSFWKGIVKLAPGTLLSLGAGYMLGKVLPISGFVSLGIFVLIYTGIYGFSMWWFMNEIEREHVRGPVKTLLSKFGIIK